MKRLWIGVGFLVVLLGLGIWGMLAMDSAHSGISEDLEQAAQCLEDTHWETATKLAKGARKRWEKNWRFSAAMADHAEIDAIDELFAELEVYEAQKDITHYAATCAALAQRISALEEEHNLTWWNLL